jgi:ligand-binding sensor domain-containing protein
MNFSVMRLVAIFIFSLWVALAHTQTPAYLHYGVKDGLPSNLVYCGLQDHNGLLWFGTDKGLVCYDGTRFRTYGMKDGLPDPEVLMMFEDSQNRLWMCCFRHKPCYFKAGKFYTAKQDTILDKINFATSAFEITEDTVDHSLWLAGMSCELYRIKDNKVTAYRLPEALVKVVRIGSEVYAFCMNDVYKHEADDSWKLEDGIVRYFPNGKRTDFVALGLRGNQALYMFASGFIQTELVNDKFTLKDQRDKPIGRVFYDRLGRCWVCTFSNGALFFDNLNFDLKNPITYLKGNKINNMFEDLQGTRWFCTSNNGVMALPQNVALNYNHQDGLLSNNITALAHNPGGGVYAGDDEGNFYALHNNKIDTFQFGSYDGYNRVRQIIVGEKGDQWVASDESLIYRSNGKPKRVRAIKGNTKSILLQHDKLWYGTSYLIGNVSPQNTDSNHILALRRFTALGEDSKGILWAGSVNGLYNEKDSFKLMLCEQFPILKSRIIAIHDAGNELLWVVTPESGLLRVKTRGGVITGVETINKFLNNPVYNIQSIFCEPEPSRRIWLATNTGVYGILPANWQVIHFDAHDGLADDDVNAVMVHKDTLWAGTVNGLTRLLIRTPNSTGEFASLFSGLRYHLQREIVDTSFIGQPFQRKTLTIPADATLIELDLSGLDFRSNGNLRYECITKMGLLPIMYWTPGNLIDWFSSRFGKHHDSSWIQDNRLNFGVNLPAGRYQFQLTAVNAGDQFSNRFDALELIRLPFWYQTIWFWLFIWGLVSISLLRIYRARIAFRELNAAASELQLQALRAQMNPHFVGNSINAIQQFFYPPDPERASEYIALFTRLLRQTMFFSEQNFVTFGEELAYNEDYLQMIQLRFSDRFKFSMEGAERIMPDMLFPAMILQPILENATIHGLAPQGQSVMKVKFSLEGEQISCTVEDNGVGYLEMQNRKKRVGTAQKSKGLEILNKKIYTLNRLYNIGLTFELQDLSSADPSLHGTRALIRYTLPASQYQKNHSLLKKNRAAVKPNPNEKNQCITD